MTIKIRKEVLGGHTHLDVFMGPDKDHVAKAGSLVLRNEEVKEFEGAVLSPHKTCSCGKMYSFIDWKELPLVGHQPTADDDGVPFNLELKNCLICRSTLACVEIK
jgi:hypothetical protein